jgi:hypothetical protein
MVIAGVLIFMRRRLTDLGQIALQTFEGDWLPLLLLLAISVTGLGLTWDYDYMEGKYYSFMAVTHAITVILFLIWIPFGKFFHIIQRPAQLGIAIYRKAGAEGPQAVCPHTGQEFASQMQVDDLKVVTKELGFNSSQGSKPTTLLVAISQRYADPPHDSERRVRRRSQRQYRALHLVLELRLRVSVWRAEKGRADAAHDQMQHVLRPHQRGQKADVRHRLPERCALVWHAREDARVASEQHAREHVSLRQAERENEGQRHAA